MLYSIFRIRNDSILTKDINMRYQKQFVQNKFRVLGSTQSRFGLSNQKLMLGSYEVQKKDGAERVFKGKRRY